MDAVATPFERFGGHDFFDLLIARFYAGVADDPVLRPMYPEAENELPPEAEGALWTWWTWWAGWTLAHRGYSCLT